MGKKKAAVENEVFETEHLDSADIDTVEEVVGSEVTEEVTEEVTHDESDEVVEEIPGEIDPEIAARVEALDKEIAEAQAKLRELKKERASFKAPTKKTSNKSYTLSPLEEGKEVTREGKKLPYQGTLVLDILFKPLSTPVVMTKEEIIAKLVEAGYPCQGDIWSNFSWYRTQVLRPAGLMD